jgi:hypothetical protein
MKRLNDSKIGLMLVVFVAAIVLGGGGIAKADFVFGESTNLGSGINSPSLDGTPCISADGLDLYFQSDRPGGLGYEDLWVTTRQTIDDPWGPPVNLTTVNSAYREAYPSISGDGLELYFSDYFYGPDRSGGQGGHDLWMTKRASLNDPWGTPVNLGSVINSSAQEVSGSISNDALVMIFASNRAGGSGNYDLWMSTRPTKQQDWGTPVNLGPLINSSGADYECCLSCDGLVLLFMSDRAGGLGGSDAWMTVRRSINDPWGPPVNLGPPVNTSAEDGNVVISADGRMLYFASTRLGGLGGWDIWQAPIIPIVDFNGDGIVDAADMCIMVGHWGEDYPLCDIGPTPMGDGIVDVQDLIVVAEHLFEEALPPGLAAYWKLDETEGGIAEDTAGDNHGVLLGEPQWQPTDGRKTGALQLDGIDDYMSAAFVLDPADGAFSAVAWIKGDAPGGVVISQVDGIGGSGETWLGTEPISGKLMTGLVAPPVGRFVPKPLVSESVITDGQWHNVGFVWDGTHRSLYVDGVEVAKDATAQAALKPATGGLYIGTDKNLEAVTFFSGLLDDVRVYNKALNAEEIAALAQ